MIMRWIHQLLAAALHLLQRQSKAIASLIAGVVGVFAIRYLGIELTDDVSGALAILVAAVLQGLIGYLLTYYAPANRT